jgi:hypothetical protein
MIEYSTTSFNTFSLCAGVDLLYEVSTCRSLKNKRKCYESTHLFHTINIIDLKKRKDLSKKYFVESE